MSTLLAILQIVATLIVVGLAFFARKALVPFLSEKGKNLATKQDIAGITHSVEEVKLAFAEHQLRSSRLFEKQLEAVDGTYERLHDAAEFVMHMVHPVQFGGEEEEKERRNSAAKAFNDLSGFYWKHKLYLPDDICTQAEALLNVMKTAFNEYTIARDARSERDSLDRWNAAYKSMKDEVPLLRGSLEARFRELLASGRPSKLREGDVGPPAISQEKDQSGPARLTADR